MPLRLLAAALTALLLYTMLAAHAASISVSSSVENVSYDLGFAILSLENIDSIDSRAAHPAKSASKSAIVTIRTEDQCSLRQCQYFFKDCTYGFVGLFCVMQAVKGCYAQCQNILWFVAQHPQSFTHQIGLVDRFAFSELRAYFSDECRFKTVSVKLIAGLNQLPFTRGFVFKFTASFKRTLPL